MNEHIKCDCGNTFCGQINKEDTCPECLKKLMCYYDIDKEVGIKWNR